MPQTRFPQSILDDILSRLDIVEIISSYLPLKRAGRNFKAVCPFHHEKTPSFMVSPDRQIYHCFGCHSGGNLFRFLMQYERMQFFEAVEVLAKKAGVTLPETKKCDAETENFVTQLYKVNELAALFYAQNLNSDGSSSVAKKYLAKRGIKEETIQLFKLGLAADRWNALIDHSRPKGVNLSLLEKAGLILPKENGGYYDRFRNRIIFPIFDIKSKPLGFGGRVLDDSLPKYINSPETPVYIKGRNLYGLNFSRDSIREKDFVVIVEGYLDFIMPYQEGLTNIVASLGTALTYEQIRLLKRYTHNVVMVYDADEAGQLATLRTLDMFVEEGMNVRVASLSEGYDPDLFVRKNGIEKFQDKINDAQNLLDYKLSILKKRHDVKEAEGKAKIASEILTTIKKFKNSILRAENIKKLAEELNVEEIHIIEEMNKVKTNPSFLDSNRINQGKALNMNPTEKLLVKLMLENTEFTNRIRENLDPADFMDERAFKIVSLVFEFFEQGKKIEPKILINYFGEGEISQAICEAAFLEVPQDNKETVLEDCIQRLKKEAIKTRRQHLHNQIKAAQHLGDEQKLQDLIREFNLLIKKRGETGRDFDSNGI